MPEVGLKVSRQGSLSILTINRPDRANALDAGTSAAIDRAITAAEDDPEIGAVLLTASGDRAFCSGMDLKEAAEIGVGHGLVPGRGFAGITERRRQKPLIAAVNGAAVAGGLEIVLACDIVIAADHALFGLAEVKRGLFAFAGGIQRLARAVPRATGLAVILTGEPITADRAYALGLVSEVVPGDQLQKRAVEVAGAILQSDPTAIANAKLLYDLAADAPVESSLRFGRAFGEATLAAGQGQSGVAAYAKHNAKT
jgi:enoyl-CoA hydratase/carnithine racemase